MRHDPVPDGSGWYGLLLILLLMIMPSVVLLVPQEAMLWPGSRRWPCSSC